MPGSVVNLTVHGIGPTDRRLDPGEDLTWVSVEQFELVLDAVAGRPDVRLTFDDGNASDVRIALPRLLARGLTGEFFVLAGLIGAPGRIDEDGVRALADAGMLVGSHGWAHRDWRRIGTEHAAQEYTEACSVIARLAGAPVSRVALPFGSYDRHVLGKLRSENMQRVYTSDGGRARDGGWLQPRNSLPHDLGPQWVHDVLDGRPSATRRVRRIAARAVKRTRG